MPPNAMALQMARCFADHPELAFELFCCASEIVDDFADYGPVIQANEDGEYDESTAITRLQQARDEVISILRGEFRSASDNEAP